MHRAPLWLMKPRFPGARMDAANVAFRPVSGFIKPRQFGPMIRIRPRRASVRISCSSLRPAAPVSRKPAVMMTAALTPARHTLESRRALWPRA